MTVALAWLCLLEPEPAPKAPLLKSSILEVEAALHGKWARTESVDLFGVGPSLEARVFLSPGVLVFGQVGRWGMEGEDKKKHSSVDLSCVVGGTCGIDTDTTGKQRVEMEATEVLLGAGFRLLGKKIRNPAVDLTLAAGALDFTARHKVTDYTRAGPVVTRSRSDDTCPLVRADVRLHVELSAAIAFDAAVGAYGASVEGSDGDRSSWGGLDLALGLDLRF